MRGRRNTYHLHVSPRASSPHGLDHPELDCTGLSRSYLTMARGQMSLPAWHELGPLVILLAASCSPPQADAVPVRRPRMLA